MELPYEQAQARLLIGAAAKALGDEEGARLELQTARDAFQRLGAHADARRATEAMTGRAGQRSGLTEREAEVLRLIAAGKSNRQIGVALAISEHTVAGTSRTSSPSWGFLSGGSHRPCRHASARLTGAW